MSKKDLIALVCKLAENDSAIADELLIESNGDLAQKDLVAAVRDAIATATYVPKHLINHNFPFDHAAYKRIEKGLGKLMSLGRMDEAMQLAVEVMKSGSAQIAQSDEGEMLDQVASCIRLVYKGMAKAGVNLAAQENWIADLNNADRVGFVLDEIEK